MAKDLETLPKFYIRGQIAPPNSFFNMFGSEETVSASDVVKFLDEHKEDPELLFEISSDGGYKSEGLEIRRLLKNSDKVIHTVGYKVNSIATVVMLGNNNGGKRLVVEDPMDFVIHFARIDPMNLGTDALTSEDFERLAEEVKKSDLQILDVYCEELGEEKRTELLAAMSEERNLGARGAIRLGFAQGYYKKKKKKEKAEIEDFKGYLIEDEIGLIIQNNMEKEKQKELETKVSGMESSISGLKKMLVKFFNGKIKNEVTIETDKGAIYVMPVDEADPANLIGASAYETDADGMKTETLAADGEYINSTTGEILVVAGGKITEVKQPVDVKKLTEDLAAERAKTATLTAELEAARTQNETIKTEMTAEVSRVVNEFNGFKKLVPGDKKEKKEKEEDIIEVDLSKMSPAALAYYHRKKEGFKSK